MIELVEIDISAARAASTLRLALCPHGCPVLMLFDENGKAFAQAHMKLGGVEEFISDLREVALMSAAPGGMGRA